MKTLIYVRHGQTVYNLNKITQGRVDSPLSELGISQVKSLKERLDLTHIDKVYVSPQGRAIQTASILVEDLYSLNIDERLRELDFGIFDGRKEYLRTPFLLFTRGMNYKLFKGNSPKEMIINSKSFLKDLEDNKTYLIVGHGCFIFSAVSDLIKKPLMLFPKNASATIVVEENNQYKVKEIL